jgi:hypothetical protein
MKLLTRDQFKELVFKRDQHKCVICYKEAIDAHHITERKLFEDGGYYLDNGSSLCSDCHIKAENTTITPQQLRNAIGIKSIVLPKNLDPDKIYDKWGNVMTYIKYPRTPHLPWSESLDDDDFVIEDVDALFENEIVMTEKMDGENTTMYLDHIHARSLDGRYHESRDWVKSLHGQIKHKIPEGWRICGENLFAKHSILYKNLPSYFLVFSIWDEEGCLDWKDTVDFAQELGLYTVPEMAKGKFTKDSFISKFKPDPHECEGYVIRSEEGFFLEDFSKHIAKYVRKNHIKTDQHWLTQKIVKNELKK